MHRITLNNEFTVRPSPASLKWIATITFYRTPHAEAFFDIDEAQVSNGHVYRLDSLADIETVHIRVVSDSSPDHALAKLWAVCDDIDAWSWNDWAQAQESSDADGLVWEADLSVEVTFDADGNKVSEKRWTGEG